MEFLIKNVGPVKNAKIKLGALTVVCGKNNTGKTYLTKTIYEFYKTFRNNLSFLIKPEQTNFPVDIDLAQYAEKAALEVRKCAKKFSTYMLDNGSLSISIKPLEFPVCCEAPALNWQHGNIHLLSFKKGSILHIEKVALHASASDEKDRDEKISAADFQNIVSTIVKHYLFSQKCNQCFFSDSFSVMSERNGLVRFKSHINIANALVASQSHKDEKRNNVEIEKEGDPSDRQNIPLSMSLIYALTLFERETLLKDKKQNDFQTQFNEDLNALVEGKYCMEKGDFFFIPDDAKDKKLSMSQSSSSVESLLLLDYYVRYFSEQGDVLVIDEPELNLHPAKQRQLARFLGTLVNAGIKVFITTHSDYIIRELNTLIMLRQNKPYLTKIKEAEGYKDTELLDASKIRAYVAQKNKDGSVVFDKAPISQDDGITISSLDTVIDKMNQIQDAIIWGAE